MKILNLTLIAVIALVLLVNSVVSFALSPTPEHQILTFKFEQAFTGTKAQCGNIDQFTTYISPVKGPFGEMYIINFMAQDHVVTLSSAENTWNTGYNRNITHAYYNTQLLNVIDGLKSGQVWALGTNEAGTSAKFYVNHATFRQRIWNNGVLLADCKYRAIAQNS